MKQHIHDAASARLAHSSPSSYDRAATLVRQRGLTIRQALESVRQETLYNRADGRRASASPPLEFERSFTQGLSQRADKQTRKASAWDRSLQPIEPSAEASRVAAVIGTPSAIAATEPTAVR